MSYSREPEPYTADGRVIVRKDGYSVIYRPDSRVLPFFCPTCDTVLLTRDDEHAMETKGCCYSCAHPVQKP